MLARIGPFKPPKQLPHLGSLISYSDHPSPKTGGVILPLPVFKMGNRGRGLLKQLAHCPTTRISRAGLLGVSDGEDGGR